MPFLRPALRARPLAALPRAAPPAALHTARPRLPPAGSKPPAPGGGERAPLSPEDDPKQGGKGFLGVSLSSVSVKRQTALTSLPPPRTGPLLRIQRSQG